MNVISPTTGLSKRISEIFFGSLDRQTISAVKCLIADGVAVAIAGTKETPSRIVADYVRDLCCAPSASVWGFAFQTSPIFAAYANAVSMHVLDFEPMSSPPTHAVSPTVPVALAIGESRGATGADVIAACAKGFEMQGRVLLASSHARGELPFHTPGVVGVLGTAVTASHLLGLDAAKLSNALGMAASRCGGLPANTGSMVKSTHCGNAAAAGLEAALLAERQFTANPNIFEAHAGYVGTVFPRHFDYDTLLSFGRPYRCADPGMAIKFYPSKYPTHFAIIAALELHRVISDASAITQVTIVTPEIEDADRPQPRGGLEGKFSFQYTAALALLDGRVGIDSFTDDRRYRADMVALLEKTSVIRDKTRSRDTRKMQVDVEVAMNDGTRHRAACNAPPGSWRIPVNGEQHRRKMQECLSRRLTDTEIAEALDLLDSLENLLPADMTQLLQILVCRT